MTSRERIAAALAGETPDRIPVALGFTEVAPERALPEGWRADEAVDIRFVSLTPSPSLDRFRRAALPHRPDTRLGTPSQAATYARWRYRPERRRRQNPLARTRSIADIRRIRFPRCEDSPRAVARLAARISTFHASGLAVGGTLPHLGGELFESAWRLRGLENFLLDLTDRPSWADALLDRLTELATGNARLLAQAGVDVLSLGDDVGMPGGMMLSPAMWQRYLKPRMAAIIAAARSASPSIGVLYHSDGSFEPILQELAQIGVNAVNPIQPEHMDGVSIRRTYGTSLALWGTVGIQTAFAGFRPDAIRAEVEHRIRTLGRGGLVLAPAYDVNTPEIRAENLIAFLEAARELG